MKRKPEAFMNQGIKMTAESPFDLLAADYDQTFTHSTVGRTLREAVWTEFEACFLPNQHILELGCGTGEDACFLARRGVRVLAVDHSREMVKIARRKVEENGLGKLVRIEHFDIETASGQHSRGQEPWKRLLKLETDLLDGAISNFGVLNCIADLQGFSQAIGAILRPGARAMFCLMGPVVLWEWVWFLLRGEADKAFRRLSRGGVPWRGLTVYYPSIRTALNSFSPLFRLKHVKGLGIFLPPGYVHRRITENHPLIHFLNAVERRVDRFRPLSALADHYLLDLERI